MKSPLLHPITKRNLHHAVNGKPHAILLSGPAGIGKMTIARWLATQLLHSTADPEILAYYLHVAPAKNVIGVEASHRINHFLQLKTTGTALIRRAIVMEDAQQMTTEAQNALLKILEEPPRDTVFILTTSQAQSLLPTIRSRLQIIPIRPPSLEQTQNYFKPASVIEPVYALANGGVGLLTELLASQTEHPLTAAIQEAKQVLSMGLYQRLIFTEVLLQHKEDLPRLIQALKQISTAGVSQTSTNVVATKRWFGILRASYEAERRLIAQTNAKAVLTDLMLHL